MMGQRDLNIFPVWGEFKFTGAVEGPLMPTNGIPLLVAAIGADGGRSGVTGSGTGNGVTGVSNGVRTGTSAAITAGATTFAYTVSTGGNPVVGDIFQVDVNGSALTAEVRKVTAVTGTTSPFTLTVDSAFNYAHAGGVAAITVVSPFTHTILQQNLLDSLTLEKQVGGFQSEQYAGCRVTKYGLKIAAGNTEATITADVAAAAQAVLTSPSAVSVVNESPFVFSEAALTLYGTQRLEVESISIEIQNGVKSKYTFAQQHTPQFISPVTRKVTGQITLVFSSLNDATYGYYNQMFNQAAGTTVPGALSLALVHPSPNNQGATFSLNKVALSKYADDIKMEDVVLSTLDYEAYLDLTVSPLKTLSATVVDGVWAPF